MMCDIQHKLFRGGLSQYVRMCVVVVVVDGGRLRRWVQLYLRYDDRYVFIKFGGNQFG